jgi:hypothetical protein
LGKQGETAKKVEFSTTVKKYCFGGLFLVKMPCFDVFCLAVEKKQKMW